MKLHCLGTTGYHPCQSQHTACYYLPEYGIVLDAGTGAFRLTEHLLNEPRQSLDIFLSHSHLDHVFGLTFLLDTLAITSLKRVRVFGESQKLAAIREHLFSDSLFPVLPPFEFCPLDAVPGEMTLENEVRIEWFALEHPGGCLGFRLTTPDGKSLAYVTDTIAHPNAAYVQHIRGVDLLLHECYFTDAQQEFAMKTGHSWFSAVCQVIDQASPKLAYLIHVSPIAELTGSAFGFTEPQRAKIRIARDMDCITV